MNMTEEQNANAATVDCDCTNIDICAECHYGDCENSQYTNRKDPVGDHCQNLINAAVGRDNSKPLNK